MECLSCPIEMGREQKREEREGGGAFGRTLCFDTHLVHRKGDGDSTFTKHTTVVQNYKVPVQQTKMIFFYISVTPSQILQILLLSLPLLFLLLYVVVAAAAACLISSDSVAS